MNFTRYVKALNLERRNRHLDIIVRKTSDVSEVKFRNSKYSPKIMKIKPIALDLSEKSYLLFSRGDNERQSGF